MILVVVDRFTKYGHFIPLKHPITVHTVAKAFTDNIFRLHGLPSVIVTNRDRIFASQLWQDLYRKLGVKLHFCTSYHPQTDGQTERVNQCLENYLRCMAFFQPRKWLDWLALVEWWYNTSYHTSLKITPFQALYNRPPNMLAQAALYPAEQTDTFSNVLIAEQTAAHIKENLLRAQARMKQQADKKRPE